MSESERKVREGDGRFYSYIKISGEMLREMLDIPDAISVVDAAIDDDQNVLVLEVSSEHPMNARGLSPWFSTTYAGDVAAVQLVKIDGYDGPMEPRPSTRRGVSTMPTIEGTPPAGQAPNHLNSESEK